MGGRYDKTNGEVLHAVDRAHSAVIQADSAKTAQEEMRHLIRALATASEVFILAPNQIQATYRQVLDGLQRQVESLAAAIPAMPPTVDQLVERVAATSALVDTFLSACQEKAGNLEKGLTTEVQALTDQLRKAAADVAWEARAAAATRRRHDLWVLCFGLALGLLLGAYLWRTAPTNGKQKSDLRGSSVDLAGLLPPQPVPRLPARLARWVLDDPGGVPAWRPGMAPSTRTSWKPSAAWKPAAALR
jgi:hypothetical protein